LKKLESKLVRVGMLGSIIVLTCGLAFSQIAAIQPVTQQIVLGPASFAQIAEDTSPVGDAPQLSILEGSPADEPQGTVGQSQNGQHHGFIVRNLRRGLEDQKQLYLAPFKPKNLKWDALFLGVTAGLLATDRQLSRQISTDHVNISHDVTLFSLLSTSAIAGGTWLYGLKTGDRHADETGQLTLETLANTFLIYTPMQFIAGRERPDEGTGNGRFWRHGGFNTSFPAGHPMFTWAMATVIAHEYPKPWVKVLTYGLALSVSVGRLTGRNHFGSDIWVGSVLGYLIGTHIFHAHCDPQFSEACHR
jgi:hypothetical protein